MEEEQAGAEPDFAARIEVVKALVPEKGATKSGQQSAIERTAVEITAVVDQMHVHDHEQEVLRSLRQSLNESFGRYRGGCVIRKTHDAGKRAEQIEHGCVAHEIMYLEAAQALEKLTREIE